MKKGIFEWRSIEFHLSRKKSVVFVLAVLMIIKLDEIETFATRVDNIDDL